MSGVIRGGVRRRRVQTAVVALVSAAAVTATVLGAGLLVASRTPFDSAFAAQNGAHLIVEADPGVATAEQFAAATPAGVVARSGPYPLTIVNFGSGPGLRPPPLTVVGRAEPGGDVDRVEVTAGRWVTGPGEIVVGEGPVRAGVGTRLTAEGGVVLTVVGTARSVSGTAVAWIHPSAIGTVRSWQMLYRFGAAGTPDEMAAARAAVTGALPAGAVTGARSWLDVRKRAVREAAVFVPFLVAFALLSIVMAVLVVGTVVAGTVGAATRRIGILKALGCTPAGIVRAFVAQALLPAVAGAVGGAVAGNLIALPVLAQTEEVLGSSNTAIDVWVTVLATAGVLAVVAVTALAAAARAGRLRTVDAIAVGRAPAPGSGRWVARVLARMPMSPAVGLGAARPFARPVRTLAILLAVASGAAAGTFAVGLASSLVRIQSAATQNTADVTLVSTALTGGTPGAAPPPAAPPPPGGAGTDGGPPAVAPPDRSSGAAPAGAALPGGSSGQAPSPLPEASAVLAAIAAEDGTRAAYGFAQAPGTAPGLTDPFTVNAYTGDASWDGFEMVSGRWFTAPGEAVAGGQFLSATGARVGDTATITVAGAVTRLLIVGEVFDTNPSVFTGPLPGLEPAEYRIALTPGTDADDYADGLTIDGLTVAPNDTEIDPLLLVVQGLTATLTLLLVAVAALGVFNMLVLDLRDRVHDLGVYKALGMTPRQTVVMVVASVAGVGLLGGLLGVPAGVLLQRLVVPAMAASGGLRLPSSMLDVYAPLPLILLALGGPAIALAGALLPAGWAARTRTASALRTE
ncbi:FtsX-like permease family protein [Catenuloplanes sp. NPDC051500]|uniref:FtsX-like permease family protein n=1 Tax=Catenuloplanes sp. NPDC051500 TaxID=3363959 RepID=UPI0037A1226B